MSEGYQSVDSNEVDNEVDQVREALVSEGARRMLESALEEEVSTFLGRETVISAAASFEVTATAIIILARSQWDSTLFK